MWLIKSSIGRKFIMALTGICLVLFVTFHVLMNAVAIWNPVAYNKVCLFLGANWYALIASAGLGLLVVIHIIDALVLTIQNRKARGNDRYQVSARPKSVEWSSQNMLVLGIVVLVFLCVHLIQFWARMQAQEIMGSVYECNGVEVAPAAGSLFLQLAFQSWYTPVIYIIGFIALWFHMNHGFWSMWQSIGWDNTVWLPRLKAIGCWWVTIVIALFTIQAVVFSVRAHEKYYLTNSDLKAQYQQMYVDHFQEVNASLIGEMNNLGQELQQMQMSGGIITNPEGYQAKQERFSEIRSILTERSQALGESLQNLEKLGECAKAAKEETPAAIDDAKPALDAADQQ